MAISYVTIFLTWNASYGHIIYVYIYKLVVRVAGCKNKERKWEENNKNMTSRLVDSDTGLRFASWIGVEARAHVSYLKDWKQVI